MIQETYGDWLTITKELSPNAKMRHLPRIKLDRLSFVTLFSEKKKISAKDRTIKLPRFTAQASK
jgi:hypothetical protein